MSRGNALVAFLGGMGAGYFKGQKDKEEKARQDKQDQMAQETHDAQMRVSNRAEADAQASDAVDAQVAKLPTNNYGTQHDMGTEDVRSMMGGSADPSSPNYVSDEAAQHYKANVTGTDQVNSNAAYYAQQGISKGLDGQAAVNGVNGVSIADPKTATAIPDWKHVEAAAQTRINSNIPAQQELGYRALAQAATMKSKVLTEGLAKARATGDPAKTLEFLNNWDNKDFPATNMRIEKADGGGYDPKNPDGAYSVIGTVNGKEKTIDTIDMAQPQYKGMTLNDVINMKAQDILTPDKMFERDKQRADAAKADAIEQRKLGQVDTENKIKADKARNDYEIGTQSNKVTEDHYKRNDSLEAQKVKDARTKAAEAGDEAAIKETKQYEKLTPAQQAIYDKIKSKDGKSTMTADSAMNLNVLDSDGTITRYNMKGEPTVLRGGKNSAAATAAGGVSAKAPALPTSKSSLVANRTYTMKDGSTATWDGKGFVAK